MPGGYDPHRAAFFDGIGGSGFVLGGWTLDGRRPRFAFDLLVQRVRAAIVARIMAAEPGEAGAVAAALLVGERSALSEATNESLRIAGLAHILAISGLHMMLIAGDGVLRRAGAARAVAAACPRPPDPQMGGGRRARRRSPPTSRFPAAGAATVRAYVMAAIMFAAILLDRPAISMRNLAIAAFVVLALAARERRGAGLPDVFRGGRWRSSRLGVRGATRRARRLADDDVVPGFRVLRVVAGGRSSASRSRRSSPAPRPRLSPPITSSASRAIRCSAICSPRRSSRPIIMPFGLLTLVVMPLRP